MSKKTLTKRRKRKLKRIQRGKLVEQMLYRGMLNADEIKIKLEEYGHNVSRRTVKRDINEIYDRIDWDEEIKRMALHLNKGETEAINNYYNSRTPKERAMWLHLSKQFLDAKARYLQHNPININTAGGDVNLNKIDIGQLLTVLDNQEKEEAQSIDAEYSKE